MRFGRVCQKVNIKQSVKSMRQGCYMMHLNGDIFDASVVTIQIANLNGTYTVVSYPFRWTIDKNGYGSTTSLNYPEGVNIATARDLTYLTYFFETQIKGKTMTYTHIHNVIAIDGNGVSTIVDGFRWEGTLTKQ